VSLIPIFTISYIISMLVEHPAMVWIRKKCWSNVHNSCNSIKSHSIGIIAKTYTLHSS
jgi:hypothetical protein